MLRRLEDIDNTSTAGPTAPAARAALATSVVAHAVVELDTQLIELKRQLGQGFSAVEPDVASALTITNAQGRLPTPPPNFRRKRHGLGSSSRGLGGRPLGSWD